MIKGVKVTPLAKISNERGIVMKMLSSTDPVFQKFGEIYFSLIYPNSIKGWHLHKYAVCNYAVPVGSIKLVLYDPRRTSLTCGQVVEIVVGEKLHSLITIPNGIWSSFKCISNENALVANFTTRPYRESENKSLDINSPMIPYSWSKIN